MYIFHSMYTYILKLILVIYIPENNFDTKYLTTTFVQITSILKILKHKSFYIFNQDKFI
jgi:hypothetical protein